MPDTAIATEVVDLDEKAEKKFFDKDVLSKLK